MPHQTNCTDMEDSFKKKMQELAEQKKKQQDAEVDAKEFLKQRKLKEDNAKQLFNNLKRDSIVPTIQELNDIFKETESLFLIFSNEKATVLKDQIRTFCQIFYYPKNRGQNKVGLNTASLLFECLPFKEEVQILENTELRPSPLKLVKTLALNEFNDKVIKEFVSKFVSDVTKV